MIPVFEITSFIEMPYSTRLLLNVYFRFVSTILQGWREKEWSITVPIKMIHDHASQVCQRTGMNLLKVTNSRIYALSAKLNK